MNGTVTMAKITIFASLVLIVLFCQLVNSAVSIDAQSQQHYYDDGDFEDFDNEGNFRELEEDGKDQQEDDYGFVEQEEEGDDKVGDVPDQKLEMAPLAQSDEDGIVESDDPDEFSHLTDEEEFIGYTSENTGPSSSRNQQARKETSKEPKITIANVPLHLRSNWDSFYLELMLVAGLAIYFANFSVGRNKNARMAMSWFEAHKTILLQHFALVGDDFKAATEQATNAASAGVSSSSTAASSATDKNALNTAGSCVGLQKESEHLYMLYCSGRTGIHSMMAELKFIKRQDLVSLVTQMFRPSSDELVLRLQLEEIDTFVMCLAAKKVAAKYIKEMTDVTTYCPGDRKVSLPMKQYGGGSIASKFVVYGELPEATTTVLSDQRVVTVLAKHLHRVNYLHISDQYSGPRLPDQDQQQQQPLTGPTKLPEVHRVIILSVQLTGESKTGGAGDGLEDSMEALRPFLLLVLHLADKLNRMKLSKEAKVKAVQNRSRVEEAFMKATHAARAERAQEKREEKIRSEREKIMENDDPDKQRKWEERENKRAAKRKAPKMKQLKVA